MKKGIFIYQAPPSFGRRVIAEPEGMAGFWSIFNKPTKSDQFLNTLNDALVDSGESITVVKDETEANLEEIASENYDFIVCAPGLQKRVVSSDNLPPIIYLESLDYHNTLVDPTVQQIQEKIANS